MQKNLYILCILLMFASNNALAKEEKQNIHNVTILVSSYDKYAPLWPAFFDHLFKNWPSLHTYNKDVPIVLVSNNIDFHNPRVTMAKSPSELGWSGNMNHALEQVKTKYILFLLDDYFLQYKVLEEKIIDIINAAEEKDLDYVEIAPRCAVGTKKVDNFPFLKYKDPIECYSTLQAALWTKDALKEMVSSKQPATIWSLEGRPLKLHKNFSYYIPRVKPLTYYNIMYQGGHISFYSYSWLYYQGYDMSFLDNYKIHPQYKFIKEAEWFRREMPRLANIVFFTVGWAKEIRYDIRQFARKLLDSVAPR